MFTLCVHVKSSLAFCHELHREKQIGLISQRVSWVVMRSIRCMELVTKTKVHMTVHISGCGGSATKATLQNI